MLKPRVSIKGADRAIRSAQQLIKKIQRENTHVLVGVQKGAGTYEDGTPIAVIAAANHFGADLGNGVEIPARPFLDVAIQKKSQRYAQIFEHYLPDVIHGMKGADDMLNAVGLAAASDVDNYIVELRDPPNAPYTIAKKGSSNPLIDKGHLRQSIRHEIAREPIEEGL